MKHRETLFSCLALLILTIVLFGPSLAYEFVYDDRWFVVDNPALDQLQPWLRFFTDAPTVAAALSGISEDVYRPLSTLSFAVNKTVSGLVPASFRWLNLFLHFCNAFLLWIFLRRRVPWGLALGSSALFLVHPVQVESVVWISQRSVLMCGLGILLTLHCWDQLDKKRFYAVLCPLAFVGALLSKESAVLFPFVFLAWGAFKTTRRKKIFFSLLGCVVIYGAWRASVLGAWGQSSTGQFGWVVSLKEGITALALYAQNLIFPVWLNVSYPWLESVSWAHPRLWVGLVCLGGLIGGLWVYRKNAKPSLFYLGLLTFFVFWLPHSGLFQLVTYAADRFLYLPLLGVALALAALPWNRWGKGFVVLSCLYFSFFTLHRVPVWKNETSLWRASVKTHPQNAFAQACLAQAYKERGDLDQAETHYKKALRSRPTIPVAESSLRQLIALYREKQDPQALAFHENKLDELIKFKATSPRPVAP